MITMQNNALAIPPEAIDDPKAREVMRIWICGDGKFSVRSAKPLDKEALDEVLVSIAYAIANDLALPADAPFKT